MKIFPHYSILHWWETAEAVSVGNHEENRFRGGSLSASPGLGPRQHWNTELSTQLLPKPRQPCLLSRKINLRMRTDAQVFHFHSAQTDGTAILDQRLFLSLQRWIKAHGFPTWFLQERTVSDTLHLNKSTFCSPLCSSLFKIRSTLFKY